MRLGRIEVVRETMGVIDSVGNPVGKLGVRVGEGYVEVEGGSGMWFVPEEMIEHQALGSSRLSLSPETIKQIDILPASDSAAVDG